MIYYFLFLICILPFGCTPTPQHMKEGYAIINSHHKEMIHALKWIPEAIGGSYYDGDIKMLSTSFAIIDEEFTIDKARELFIEGTQRFLTSINTSPKVIPHLNHYPFTENDLSYSIGICSKDDRLLGHVFISKGNVVYSIADEAENLQTLHRESYKEALQKVLHPSP